MTGLDRPDRRATLTAAFCLMLVTHTYLRLVGAVSTLQLLIVILYCWLVFPAYARNMVLSGLTVLAVSSLQYWLYDQTLHSSVFPERVLTYPLLFCFLILFMVTIVALLKRDRLAQNVIYGFAWAFLGVSSALATASLAMNNENIVLIFYNNPNEMAVAITAALLYILFGGASFLPAYLAAAMTVLVVFACGSRFSMLYVLGLMLLYALARKSSKPALTKRRILLYVGCMIAAVGIVTALLFSPAFYIGPFDEFGVVPSALWLGWDAKTPVVTSVGYRINNVLAGLASLRQTLGLGIGLGRSPGLTERISGLTGSIHVSPVEVVVELGLYTSALVGWLNLREMARPQLRTALYWFAIGTLGMCAQSSAYLTSYAAWFFILALCQVKLENVPAADQNAQ